MTPTNKPATRAQLPPAAQHSADKAASRLAQQQLTSGEIYSSTAGLPPDSDSMTPRQIVAYNRAVKIFWAGRELDEFPGLRQQVQ